MQCSKCGASLANSTDTFCSICGTPVTRAAGPGVPPAAPVQPGYQPVQPQKSQYPAPGPTGAPYGYTPSANVAPVKKKSALPLIILIVLLVVAAAAAVWYFFLRDKDPADDGATQKSASSIDYEDEEDEETPRSKRETATQSEREPRQGGGLPGLLGRGNRDGEASPPETAPAETATPASTPEPIPEPEPEPPQITYPPPVFDSVVSSDVTDSPSGRNYLPDQAVDGNPETAWNVPGTGDEWIVLESSKEQYVTGLRILNGYTKYSPEYKTWLYYSNNRPKDITILFSDGSYMEWTLRDIFDEDNYYYQDIPLDTPILTTYVMIYIDSVYDGDRWDDICISEIEVY